jgi:hypothetical protein
MSSLDGLADVFSTRLVDLPLANTTCTLLGSQVFQDVDDCISGNLILNLSFTIDVC